jgi:queuine tRNA-ribosyltransferase
MDRPAFSFEVLHDDAASLARRGKFTTPHGVVETPAFMPVGTQGTVKGVDAGRLRETGAQMILANTYHLAWVGMARSSPIAAGFKYSASPIA